MKKILALLMVLTLVLGTVAFAEEAAGAQPAFAPIQRGEWSDFTDDIQQKLNDLGFNAGKVDGIFGKRTEQALKDFQAALGLEQTGIISSQEALDMILAAVASDGVNLATGTEETLTLAPSGENSWAAPLNFYPTSEQGLALLKDPANKLFTVSFDWKITGADTAVDAAVGLKYTEKAFAPVSSSPLAIAQGDSSGHFKASFIPSDAMRQIGTGWALLRIGEATENRGMKIEISNFVFETGLDLAE